MIIYGEKEYFPLELETVVSGSGRVAYSREGRSKSYFYICLEAEDSSDGI